MKPNRSSLFVPPLIAAARRRPLRGGVGEGVRMKRKNNYIAEIPLSHGPDSENAKRPGAPPGNLNAVKFPHRTSEDVALYYRGAAFLKAAKSFLRDARAELRARKKAVKAPK